VRVQLQELEAQQQALDAEVQAERDMQEQLGQLR
jgi:hypothetical protein